MKNRYKTCAHPDHVDGESCLDRSIGCSKYCLCCMGELAVPVEPPGDAIEEKKNEIYYK